MQFQITLPNLKDKKTARRSSSKNRKEGTPNHHIHELHPTIWENNVYAVHITLQAKIQEQENFSIRKYFQQSK